MGRTDGKKWARPRRATGGLVRFGWWHRTGAGELIGAPCRALAGRVRRSTTRMERFAKEKKGRRVGERRKRFDPDELGRGAFFDSFPPSIRSEMRGQGRRPVVSSSYANFWPAAGATHGMHVAMYLLEGVIVPGGRCYRRELQTMGGRARASGSKKAAMNPRICWSVVLLVAPLLPPRSSFRQLVVAVSPYHRRGSAWEMMGMDPLPPV